ncbi:MAG: hypothetical protein IKH84_00095, partial [Ottowia sp.]|nr:hypothetical protein [Ottowia sp.]
LICFSLASCCAIAFVRINLSDPAASRYYPIAATMLAGNALAFRHPEKPWHKIVAILLAALTTASFVYNYGVQFKEAPQHKQRSRAVRLYMCSGKDKNKPWELAWIAQSPGDRAYSDLNTMRRIFCREKDMCQIQPRTTPLENSGAQR